MKDDYLVPPIKYKRVKGDRQAIVVGAGPGGLFAALRLIELGVKPIVLERGKNVKDRRLDVAAISRQGKVDPDSNYCFGEGGAGAYSDGKLYTRSKKRGSVDRILGIFHQHGASENILIDAHPHIGSDKLPGIIENMRNTILDCGGEVHFMTRVNGLKINESHEVVGVKCVTGEEFDGPVILATGHSARDVYQMLFDAGISMEEKGIAVGVRLEHPQHIIDQIQYHKSGGRGDYLPAAEYSFVTQIDDRGVYSFCMCPGGIVVPAASEPGQLVVNGMSPSTRGSYWANSGMVVQINPEDIEGNNPLRGLQYQEELESLAPVMAVQGNMDRVNGIDLPKAKVIEAEGLKIGIVHGEVYPRADSDQLLYLAKELNVDILVSGHSHQPKIEQKEGILLLNPGSPIVPRLADRTVMLLEIDNRQVDVEIVKIGAPVCSALDFDQYKRD